MRPDHRTFDRRRGPTVDAILVDRRIDLLVRAYQCREREDVSRHHRRKVPKR